jgi:hypothetical protein
LLTLLLLLLQPAMAEGPEAWASLHDGLLNQSMDREPYAAIASYEALLSGTPEGDPMRGDLLYWLGRARLASGDATGALETLGAAGRVWSTRARARSLMGRLRAQKQAVRRLPFFQGFESSSSPWVRGWDRGRDTDLELDRSVDGQVAAWHVEVREGQEDFLTFAVQTDGAPVSGISLRLQATEFPMVVELHLADAEGGLWRAPMSLVPAGRWISVDLPLKQFVNLDSGVAAGHISGSSLRWVKLKEVTALHLEDRGKNRLLIDDLALR